MSKLIIMQGLPASGKSTRAEELLREDGNAVRVNRDLLRTMLHFDKFTGKNEGLTKDAARTLARLFLEKGINVIIDDTNLHAGTVQSWVDLAKETDAKIQYERLTTPVDTCLERDEKRQKRVGKHVIQKMALQHMEYLKGEKVVICDMDGTLADVLRALTDKWCISLGDGSFDLAFGEVCFADAPTKTSFRWNLAKDNLGDQSPETIDFLTSVLCNG